MEAINMSSVIKKLQRLLINNEFLVQRSKISLKLGDFKSLYEIYNIQVPTRVMAAEYLVY